MDHLVRAAAAWHAGTSEGMQAQLKELCHLCDLVHAASWLGQASAAPYISIQMHPSPAQPVQPHTDPRNIQVLPPRPHPLTHTFRKSKAKGSSFGSEIHPPRTSALDSDQAQAPLPLI